jgi:hypothetical protein
MVCFDESPKQLIAEVREPIPAEPGSPARYDTEYERKGVCDLMMMCEPKRGFRQVDITDRRTKIEFAHCMKQIADLYPDAAVIRVDWIILIPIKSLLYMKHFPPNRHGNWRKDWSSTTPQNMAAG